MSNLQNNNLQQSPIFHLIKYYTCTYTQYFALPEITIGGYDFASIDEQGNPTPITMELSQYKVVEFDTFKNTYTLNGDLNKSVFL